MFRTTSTTTTTTEAPDYSEYEEEEEDTRHSTSNKHHSDKESEEDPKVIKELIELIRKVGGIDELEKHLSRNNDGTIALKSSSSGSSSSSSSQVPTTPSSISKSLYDKVLSKPNALNSIRNSNSFRIATQTKTVTNTESDEELVSEESDARNSGTTKSGYSKYSSVVRGANSRQGPQNEGIDKLTEFDGFLKEKKQYTTITRNRGSQKASRAEEEDEEETVAEAEPTEDDENDNVKSSRRTVTGTTPTYSSIRRTRPTTTATTNVEDDVEEEQGITEKKQYSTLNRNRSRVATPTTTAEPDTAEVTAGSTR